MSGQPADFARLFGQLGQAMQNNAANARVSQDAASQPFEGVFTQLFGQVGHTLQRSAANMHGQDGANEPFHSSNAAGTNQQTGGSTTAQESNGGSSAENGNGSEAASEAFGNLLRGMATGVAQAFQNSSGFQEGMAHVASDFSTGLEQAVQNMTSSPEFQEFQETMTNLAHMFENQQTYRPPTSETTLQSLPKVQVTDHDLQQEQNSSCSICLEQYTLGETALRLPCGHLFHEGCCKHWLTTANTCPVCRFELPTDDAAYEQARRDRMQTEHRRPRLRRVDLAAKSLSELRHFADFLGVDCTGCIEKRDLVDRIATSGFVEIIPEPAEEQHADEVHTNCRGAGAAHSTFNTDSSSLARLEKMTVREIKAEMSRLGVDHKGCLEKSDLIDRLMFSGSLDMRQEPQ